MMGVCSEERCSASRFLMRDEGAGSDRADYISMTLRLRMLAASESLLPIKDRILSSRMNSHTQAHSTETRIPTRYAGPCDCHVQTPLRMHWKKKQSSSSLPRRVSQRPSASKPLTAGIRTFLLCILALVLDLAWRVPIRTFTLRSAPECLSLALEFWLRII